MTTLGLLTMTLSVGGVTLFLGWCIYKVLSNPETAEHLHSQADIEPPDIQDED